MKKTLTYDQALHRAAVLCTRSEKCVSDIRAKLVLWGVDESDIKKMLSYLQEEKYLDDVRFCSYFVKDKSRFNKWGKIKIAYALRAKKIDEDLIANSLDQLEDEESLSTLLSILTTKSKNSKFKDDYDKKVKLIRFALSRGFEMKLVNQALKTFKL